MKAVLTVLTLAVISVGVFLLGSLRRDRDGESILNVAGEVALTVNTAQPERGEIIRLVQAPGDVEAVSEVEISSEIVSKIVFMAIEEGDAVHEGDLLCRLDDRNLRADEESGKARIAQLRAAVVLAEADLEKADRDMLRQKRLSESEATSDLELRDALTIRKKAAATLDMRKHELSQVEAFLKRTQEDLKKTVITSPIDGVVSKLNAKQGEVVITGTMNNPGTVIMSISNLSQMQVRARIDEVDVPLVRPGQKSRIYLQSDSDKPVPARVVRVATKGTKPVGRDVVTFEALLEVLSDDARIKPGMTANVEIEVARCPDALTVPVEAVVHRMRKDLPEQILQEFDARQAGLDLSERARRGQYIKVLYVMKDETARVRLIDPGIADTRRVEIREGIASGEEVIIGPYRSLDQLKNGKKVALAKKENDQGVGGGEKDGEPGSKMADDNQNDSKQGGNKHASAAGSSP